MTSRRGGGKHQGPTRQLFGKLVRKNEIIWTIRRVRTGVRGKSTSPPPIHSSPLTLMPWHLKAIVPEQLCFFTVTHPNDLHFVLRLQVWTYSENKLWSI